MIESRSEQWKAHWTQTYHAVSELLGEITYDEFCDNPWKHIAELSRFKMADRTCAMSKNGFLSKESINAATKFPYDLTEFIQFADNVYMDMLKHNPRSERNKYRVH